MFSQMPLFYPETSWQAPTEYWSILPHAVIGLDIETHDPELKEKGIGVRRGAYIVGVAIATPTKSTYYPIKHPEDNVQFDVLGMLREEAKTFSGVLVGANLMYDLDFLAHRGIYFPHAKIHDVLITESLFEPAYWSLEEVATKYCIAGKDDALLIEAGKTFGVNPKSGMAKIPCRFVGQYAEQDASLPLQIMEKQFNIVSSTGLEQCYRIEHNLFPILLHMRQRGVRVDIDKTGSTLERLQAEYNALFKLATNIAGRVFSIWAVESFAGILKERGLSVPLTELSGKDSVTQAWLELNKEDTLCVMLLKLRKIDKIINTFLKGHILGYQVNGRVHPQFHQLKGEFGGTPARFSSSHPNLQQIPSRDPELSPLLRKLFLPEKDEIFERLDWSQIEYRFLAHYAMGKGSDEVRERYNTNPDTDFHQVCADLAGIKDRKKVKNVNFGVVYGAGKETLAAQMGVGLIEADQFLRTYHAELPFVKYTYNKVMTTANERGYIKNIVGGRRYFNTFIAGKRAYTYKALNALLQDSAAYLMKVAMIDIWKSGVCSTLGVPLLTVHDELCFSRPQTKEGAEAMDEVHHIMENCMELKVPILAKRESGLNWGECI